MMKFKKKFVSKQQPASAGKALGVQPDLGGAETLTVSVDFLSFQRSNFPSCPGPGSSGRRSGGPRPHPPGDSGGGSRLRGAGGCRDRAGDSHPPAAPGPPPPPPVCPSVPPRAQGGGGSCSACRWQSRRGSLPSGDGLRPESPAQRAPPASPAAAPGSRSPAPPFPARLRSSVKRNDCSDRSLFLKNTSLVQLLREDLLISSRPLT